MSRLIDADALRAEFPMPKDMLDPNQALVHITGIWAEIDNAPTIEERKTGKWITETDTNTEMLACSSCGGRVIAKEYDTAVGMNGYTFCPYCGAKMERGEEE